MLDGYSHAVQPIVTCSMSISTVSPPVGRPACSDEIKAAVALENWATRTCSNGCVAHLHHPAVPHRSPFSHSAAVGPVLPGSISRPCGTDVARPSRFYANPYCVLGRRAEPLTHYSPVAMAKWPLVRKGSGRLVGVPRDPTPQLQF